MTSEGPPVLEASDLEIEFATGDGCVRALDSATLTVRRGEITALVGESGSGKSTLGMAAGRMLAGNAQLVGGDLRVAGESVLRCEDRVLQALRRDVVGFVFQNPVTALDPTMRIARQIDLAAGAGERLQSPAEALERVGLRDVERVLTSYPHELSGGMAQRVGVAMALRRHPQLLIADEPTAAVDATLRPQILELLIESCRAESSALLLLTHDLHAVAKYCARVMVMYAGRVVEDGPAGQVLADPKHPYTRALLRALPGEEAPGERLEGIAGAPPVLHAPARGCAFAPRCPSVLDRCRDVRPAHRTAEGRALCCHLFTGDASRAPAGAHPSR